MAWSDKISGAFGAMDKRFSGHGCDTIRAAELLATAVSEGVGFSDYLSEIESWLRTQSCTEEHIKEQMNRIRDIKNYF